MSVVPLAMVLFVSVETSVGGKEGLWGTGASIWFVCHYYKTHNVTDSVIEKATAGRLCLWRKFELFAKPLDWSSDYALKLNLCSNSGVGLGGGATI